MNARRSRPRGRAAGTVAAGVTLLELLVAVAILGAIAALLYGTFSRSLAVRERASQTMERYATARAAFAWLEQDLEASFGVGSYPTGAKRFFSLGMADQVTKGKDPLLDITTTTSRSTTPLAGALPLADDLDRLGDHGDQARVLYHLEAPADDRDGRSPGLDLVRYEYRPPTSLDLEDAARAVVARRIRSIELRFFDGGQWRESWDAASQSEGGNALAPRVVRTRLRLDDGNGGVIEVVAGVYLIMGGRRG